LRSTTTHRAFDIRGIGARALRVDRHAKRMRADLTVLLRVKLFASMIEI